MTISMTGFAAGRGAGAGASWIWDIRSVNGKGLDLRLRVPDWIDGLELALRGEIGRAMGRGNVNLTLRVTRDVPEAEALRLNTATLRAVLAALSQVEAVSMEVGVTLAQPSPADVLTFRGVVEAGAADEDTAPLRAAILADLPGLLADFTAMRAAEGAALQAVILGQLDQISRLTEAAAAQAEARKTSQADTLRDAVGRLLAAQDHQADPARLAQELALLAVKTDVTEELDRLRAHVGAARDLLAEAGQVGRKLDFLMQEFMREANTLCSKAQDIGLTRIGLDLKTVIDQMREQVQNVE